MNPATRKNAGPIAGIAILAISLVGCANWKSAPTSKLQSIPLKEVRESEKQLVLEFEFVRVDLAEQQEQLWRSIDETKIDVKSRHRLLANGIRVGYAVDQERFRQTLSDSIADRDIVDRFFDQAEIASDVASGAKRTPMRMGRRHELPLQQPIQGSHVALVRIGDETIGRTLVNPQYLFSITPTRAPTRHAEVTLTLRPEIQHGDVRQRYVRSDRALRIDASRETWAIGELDFQVNMQQGDVVVIGPAAEKRGMAAHMFASDTQNEDEHVLLLIRAAQVPSPEQ